MAHVSTRTLQQPRRVVNNGTNNVFVLAAWNSGLWRYVEP